MINEVLSRVDLIISVEGSRRISRENLQFLFDKYELSEEDREKVLDTCKEKGILIFQESNEPTKSYADEIETETSENAGSEKEEGQEKKKQGFFARLFRR